MKSLVNRSSDLKLEESIEMQNFNAQKLKEFDFDNGSRPSDPEHPEIFMPSTKEVNGRESNSPKRSNETHEGVDDYDEENENHSSGNGKVKRSSLTEKYDFGGI